MFVVLDNFIPSNQMHCLTTSFAMIEERSLKGTYISSKGSGHHPLSAGYGWSLWPCSSLRCADNFSAMLSYSQQPYMLAFVNKVD